MKTTHDKFVIHDLETYPNCFLAGFIFPDGRRATFQISDRVNEIEALIHTLIWLKDNNYIMVGFNSLGFDYHILHRLLNSPMTFSAMVASQMAQDIINSQNDDKVYPINFTDRIIPQLDLYLMNHFDNAAKRTSLKKLEFNLRMSSIEDLPFPIRTLTYDEMDILRYYLDHDLDATLLFFNVCKEQIDLRIELKAQGLVTGDTLNMSDVKLGEQFFVTRMGRDEFYINGKKKQSTVKVLSIKDVILPYIKYNRREFNIMLEAFKSTTWVDGQEFNWPSVTVNGVEYVYGRGGIHASNVAKEYKSDDEGLIIDLDVTSMYPSIAIVNNIKPQHLSDRFNTEYSALKSERVKHGKNTAINKVLKLGLNGVFGNSGNPYSIFFDNKYLMSTTVNGQLLITLLIDKLIDIPNLVMIQANTDGVTFKVPSMYLPLVEAIKAEWQTLTKLDLEEARYSRFICRDVNNYIGVYDSGKVKAKGAYWFPESIKDYDGQWSKNYSAMIIPKIARKVLVDKADAQDELFKAVLNGDKYDFALLHTNSRGSELVIGDTLCGKNTRYAVTVNGLEGVIKYPPKGKVGAYKRKNGITDALYESVLAEVGDNWDTRIHTANKSTYTDRSVSLVANSKVTQCNNIDTLNLFDIDFNWYLEEINKLTKVFK